ncbi:hypothetical protein LAZ67_X002320 [Cordylochernes scorpioides]|uniref:Uncharacterized protein n=1 Tax=Cordylochernes scorpioides TaxID=51811 RepID=A0ABY6LT97_9ARAC|nr:hypothetical protein LAZ67_X002320 [Cordylochernes scorpioides]
MAEKYLYFREDAQVQPLHKITAPNKNGEARSKTLSYWNVTDVNKQPNLGCNQFRGRKKVHNTDIEKEFTFKIGTKREDPFVVTVLVSDKPLQMEVDTGSGCTVISEKTYMDNFADIQLIKTHIV